MFIVNHKIMLPENEIELSAIRSSGAGGQNVNKVATAIHLRFSIHTSSLDEIYKQRLLELHDKRISKEGEIIIKAQRYRTQEKNRADALERFRRLLASVTVTRPVRRATQTSRAAKRRRLADKQHRARIKANRGRIEEE